MSSLTVVGSASGVAGAGWGVTLTADVPCSTPTVGSWLMFVASVTVALDYPGFPVSSTTTTVTPWSFAATGTPRQFFQPKVGAYDLCHPNGIGWVGAPGTLYGNVLRSGSWQYGTYLYGSVLTDSLLSGTTLYFDAEDYVYSVDIALINVVGANPGGGTPIWWSKTRVDDGVSITEEVTSNTPDGLPGYIIGIANGMGFLLHPQLCKRFLGFVEQRGPDPGASGAIGAPWTTILATGGPDCWRGDCVPLGLPCAPANYSYFAPWNQEWGWMTVPVGGDTHTFGFSGDVGGGLALPFGAGGVADGGPGLVTPGFSFEDGTGIPYCTGETGATGPAVAVLSTRLRGTNGPGDDG